MGTLYNYDFKKTTDNLLDYCIYCTLSVAHNTGATVFKDDIRNNIISNIKNPYFAACILDDLKSKLAKEQKTLLLDKILKSDDLETIIKNHIFDKYIVKEIIKSNPSEIVLLEITKKYIKNDKDIKYYTSKLNKELIQSLLVFIKLEG